MPARDLDTTYDDDFYGTLAADVARSAEVVVPLVMRLVEPRSVLDVGCGRGTWLRVFAEHGVTDLAGVDGPHVRPEHLEIAPSAFVAHDLGEPLRLGRRFDLAVSLEVAEHLDPAAAPAFVRSLVEHAPVVLFSAAIPYQGGAGHVNEAWQSTWAARFAEHGFVPLDVVRPAVWADGNVAFWYRQNTLLYGDEVHAARLARASGIDTGRPVQLDLVHPALYTRTHTTPPAPPKPLSLSRVLRELPRAAASAVSHRFGGRSG